MEPLKVIIEGVPEVGNSQFWFNVVQGFLTLVIAGIVAYIAYQQHKTDKRRLKKELYPQRQEIFKIIDKLFIDWTIEGLEINHYYEEIHSKLNIGKFLFDKKEQEFIAELGDKLLELAYTNKKLERNLEEIKRREINDKKEKLEDWIYDEGKLLNERFSKYFEMK